MDNLYRVEFTMVGIIYIRANSEREATNKFNQIPKDKLKGYLTADQIDNISLEHTERIN
jgi:hypothetical protein